MYAWVWLRRGGAEEEGEREFQASSTCSMESNAGLNPMTLRSWWPGQKWRFGHLMNWATQVPLVKLDLPAAFPAAGKWHVNFSWPPCPCAPKIPPLLLLSKVSHLGHAWTLLRSNRKQSAPRPSMEGHFCPAHGNLQMLPLLLSDKPWPPNTHKYTQSN